MRLNLFATFAAILHLAVLPSRLSAQPTGYPVYPGQPVSWLVIGSGTETWYTQGQGSQSVTVRSPLNTDNGNSAEISFTATENGTATLSYQLDVSGLNGYAEASVVNSSQTELAGAEETYVGDLIGSKTFGVAAGSTYFLSGSGSIFEPESIDPVGGGSFMATVSYPVAVSVKNTATRTRSDTGSGSVSALQGTVNLGGFYAVPEPADGGTISSVSYTLSGNNPYVVVAFSDTGTTSTSNPNASIRAQTVAPSVITSSTSNLIVAPGSAANFSVTATGAAPLSYQWYYNASPIPEATEATFSIQTSSSTNNGIYSVGVSNGVGAVLSIPTTLTVLSPPVITTEPASQNVPAGSTVSLFVAASGVGTLGYQWLFNGTPMSSATSSVLSLTDIQSNGVGAYSVVVSNTVAAATSAPPAQITIYTPAPLAIDSIKISGANLVVNGLNGLSGQICSLLATTNLSVPLDQWPTLATDTLAANGNFTITVSNVGANGFRQEFIRLRMQPPLVFRDPLPPPIKLAHDDDRNDSLSVRKLEDERSQEASR
jgi:hypothetical protein